MNVCIICGKFDGEFDLQEHLLQEHNFDSSLKYSVYSECPKKTCKLKFNLLPSCNHGGPIFRFECDMNECNFVANDINGLRSHIFGGHYTKDCI